MSSNPHAPAVEDVRSLIRAHKRWDTAFAALGLFCMLFGIVVLFALVGEMLRTGLPRLELSFFTEFPSRRASQAGVLSALVGSFYVMLVTALVAIPIGVAAGVYLEEYAPKNAFTNFIELNISNLAAVPSIIYGLLGLGLFVYTFGLGHSILSAGLTLALLILPVIIVATRESIRGIPQWVREAAYGCGATRWQVVSDHILPYSLPGTLTGVIIGLARAIGESAPLIVVGAVTFIASLPPVPFVEGSLAETLLSDFTVMPIQMFNWTSRPEAAFQVNAAAAGVVLIALTLGMNGVAIWLRYRLRKAIKW
ncbi:MAG: phosphate ABC transporter permease PstA [Rhodocyclaceae bacterium]|nr:phosphate ABC transporter permease PstA [Rhodocyclaceae bacterium]